MKLALHHGSGMVCEPKGATAKERYPQITQITQIRAKGNKSKRLLDPVKKCP